MAKPFAEATRGIHIRIPLAAPGTYGHFDRCIGAFLRVLRAGRTEFSIYPIGDWLLLACRCVGCNRLGRSIDTSATDFTGYRAIIIDNDLILGRGRDRRLGWPTQCGHGTPRRMIRTQCALLRVGSKGRITIKCIEQCNSHRTNPSSQRSPSHSQRDS